MDRLQMHKYKSVSEITLRVEEITKQIYVLLVKGESIDMADTEHINSLYIERKDLIKILIGFVRSSNDGIIGDTNFKLEGDEEEVKFFFNKLEEIDLNNINLLKINITKLAEKLKEMNQNKSLMIYSK